MEHLIDAGCRSARFGKDHHEICHIYDGEQRLRHVVYEGDDLALREIVHVHLDTASPQDGTNSQVHHQKRHGVERRGQAPRSNRRLRLIGSGLMKALSFVLLAYKSSHHTRARKPFTTDKRNAVEFLLHLLEIRHATRHHNPKDNTNERRGNKEDSPELHVDKQRCDHGANCQKRPANQLAHAQGHGKLHLVNVVGNTRDERGCAKAIELGVGKFVDMLVKLSANHRSHTLRCESGHLLAYKCEQNAQGSHCNQQQSVHNHSVNVARAHTAIDHAGDDKRCE